MLYYNNRTNFSNSYLICDMIISVKKTIVLENERGMKVTFSPLGASLLDIGLKMKNGHMRNVALRPKALADFASSKGYYGKTIGRYSGRLKDSKLAIDGIEYKILETKRNSGLHGGDHGLSNALFDYEKIGNSQGKGLIFSYQMPHLFDGLPGNLQVFITYLLHDDANLLEIRYQAKSDHDTICNLTNHTYFNLDGRGCILNHELMIAAQKYAEVDEDLMPNKVLLVDEVMDFSQGRKIGTHIAASNFSCITRGYDHPYILDNPSLLIPSAQLTSSNKDLSLNIYSTYPCLVFYSGNYPTSEAMTLTKKMQKHGALALEPQYLPNAINNPFGQTKTGFLKAGSLYQETIIYEFVIR